MKIQALFLFCIISVVMCGGIAASDSSGGPGVTVIIDSAVPGPSGEPVVHPPRALPVPAELAETLPQDRLTTDAKAAVTAAPAWLQDRLRDNMELLDAAHQDIYADMILNPADTRYTDEIAFCVAEIASEILMNEIFLPELIAENVMYVYEHDQYLDYVEIVDEGTPGEDPDYYSTTRYTVEEDGQPVQYLLDRDIYYWFIVHPKIEDEMVDYIDPDQVGDMHADPPVGVFWRDWIFTYTEPKPGMDEDYPVLRDAMAGVNVLWKNQTGGDNGAVGEITEWIKEILQFTSGAERPHQPVRIYKLHMGRCGEFQDFTSAAARACLIPCLNTQAIGEDHVWNEFWDRRWIHWEPVNTMVDVPRDYEDGWGKVFSGVVDVRSDGWVWDVIGRYSRGKCTVNINVEDAGGQAVDGVLISLRKGGYAGTFGFTGSDGALSLEYGDALPCKGRATSADLGQVPPFPGLYTITDETADGETYTWDVTLPGVLPELPIVPADPPVASTPQRLAVTYTVTGEVIRGYYLFDENHTYTRRVDTGDIDFFIVDEANWDLYTSGETFEGHLPALKSSAGDVSFELPAEGDWSVVFSAERKLTCKQIVDVTVTLEMEAGGLWYPVDSVNRTVEIPPGERYVVSATAGSLPDGVMLTMPSDYFQSGDPCYLTAFIGNTGGDITEMPLFVLLDAYGQYFFWPSWNMLPEMDWQTMDIPAGGIGVIAIPEFSWPADVGSAAGLYFYGAVLDPSMSSVWGDLDMWQFGYGE